MTGLFFFIEGCLKLFSLHGPTGLNLFEFAADVDAAEVMWVSVFVEVPETELPDFVFEFDEFSDGELDFVRDFCKRFEL